jgi:uncharacterized protein
MKVSNLLAGLAGLAVLVGLAGCGTAAGATPAQAADKPPAGITVVGEGQVYAVPDVANVTFGVETTGQTAKAAMDANSQQLNQVIAKLKSLGVGDREIQSSGLNVYPVYEQKQPQPQPDSSNTPPRIVGYRASNGVVVTISDLSKAPDVLDGVIAAGANNVSGLNFSIKDTSQLRQQALSAAGKQAQAKAKVVADSLGVKIVSVASANEDISVSPQPMPVAARAAASSADSVPVVGGELTVTARLQVTYNIQ